MSTTRLNASAEDEGSGSLSRATKEICIRVSCSKGDLDPVLCFFGSLATGQKQPGLTSLQPIKLTIPSPAFSWTAVCGLSSSFCAMAFLWTSSRIPLSVANVCLDVRLPAIKIKFKLLTCSR